MMIRVFPRRNAATPTDDMAFYDGPPLWDDVGQNVYVSCTFIEDKPRAEMLAALWDVNGRYVTVGGPAYNDKGGDFVPGRYLKPGYVITSRGCNNSCWFCYTWKREGGIRELPITDGFNVLDSNLLQCSEPHIRAVFDMLGRQKEKALFTGGLEAKQLKGWHVDLLVKLKPQRIFFAYDEPDDYEPLATAAEMVIDANVCGKHERMCYVLIGYIGDTIEHAEQRLQQTLDLGLTPMAMLYSGRGHTVERTWRKF